MKQALTTQKEPTEVIPVSPTDAKAWELVNRVLTWMADNACYNYSKCFRELGVAPASYYRAIKAPYVQNRMLERMEARNKAAAKVLEEHWPHIMANMAQIAQGSGREAVQAARFLGQEKEKIREQGGGQQPEGKSEARALLDRFTGKSKRVTARRTVVTEEVELSPDKGESGVVIEG